MLTCTVVELSTNQLMLNLYPIVAIKPWLLAYNMHGLHTKVITSYMSILFYLVPNVLLFWNLIEDCSFMYICTIVNPASIGLPFLTFSIFINWLNYIVIYCVPWITSTWK
jgi:hypothetical protein